ncbi:MAG: phage portal protein [Bacillota bacterium]
MTAWNWFLSLFNKDTKSLSLDAFIGELASEIYFKQLAIQSCINLISNVLSKAEFQTFEKGSEVRKDNYYLFNVEPNPNKSASKFWRQVISNLVYDNVCLVIQYNGYFYVADSFHVDRYAFKNYVYRDIVIDDFQLNRSYEEPDVFHFELHNERIRDVIDGLYNSYSKLIAAAQRHYKKQNARRGKLIVPTNYPQTDKAQTELQDLLQRKFKRFFDAEGDAVVPITNGLQYEELENKANGVKGSVEGRDIRAFIDDIFDFVAIAFNIPPQLLKGNVADTEKAMDNLMTFCINPLAETLQDEVNRKYYGKKAFLERAYMRINTSMIRAHDIKDIAGALETLFRIGGYCIDDILVTLGMEPLNTEWSKQRFVTKNYAPVESVIAGGGDGG